MKKILLTLLLFSSIFAQANRILTLAPTAQVSSIGNVTLPMMNPARNLFDKDHFSFSRVNWMTNIVNDMSYNFINVDRGPYGINIMFFNYGVQNQTDEFGIIQNQFTPLSAVYGFSYARKVSKYNLGLDVKLITHDLHTQDAKGLVLGVGGYFPKIYKDLDLDVMVRNFGFAPKFGSYKSELPTSLNIAEHIHIKILCFMVNLIKWQNIKHLVWEQVIIIKICCGEKLDIIWMRCTN